MSIRSTLIDNGYKEDSKQFYKAMNDLYKVSNKLHDLSYLGINRKVNKNSVRYIINTLIKYENLKCDIGNTDKDDLLEFLKKSFGVLTTEWIGVILNEVNGNSTEVNPKKYGNNNRKIKFYIEAVNKVKESVWKQQ